MLTSLVLTPIMGAIYLIFISDSNPSDKYKVVSIYTTCITFIISLYL